MTDTNLTERDVDQLVAIEKLVGEPLIWRPAPPHGFRLEADVYCPERDLWLRLIGSVNRVNHSFSLLYDNFRVRGYDTCKQHTNPDGERITEPHKHRWRDVHQDREAYIPSDIDPDSNVNDQFEAFCGECNITLLSPYQGVMKELSK